MRKKLLSVLLVASMVATMFVGCGSSSSDNNAASDATASTEEGAAESTAASDYKIAMITDSGDITDMSFNQTTYEAAKAFAEANGAEFQYYKPTEDSDDARIASFENAVTDGYNVIVVPGYLFAKMIAKVAPDYPNVTIIALDCGEVAELAHDGVNQNDLRLGRAAVLLQMLHDVRDQLKSPSGIAFHERG